MFLSQQEYLKKTLQPQWNYTLWVCPLKLKWTMGPSVEKLTHLFGYGHQLTLLLGSRPGMRDMAILNI